MNVTLVFHRFLDAERRWIDTPDTDAAGSPGVLAPGKNELEATISFDEVVQFRDTPWPLAWRFCLEPVPALLGGQKSEWIYRCFAQSKAYTFKVDGDQVRLEEDQQPKLVAPARELWPALVDAGGRVVALAERDRGPTDREVALLRPSLERAQAALRECGWT